MLNEQAELMTQFAQLKLLETLDEGLNVTLINLFCCPHGHFTEFFWWQVDEEILHQFNFTYEDGRLKIQTHLCANKEIDAAGELIDPEARRARDIIVSVFGPSTVKVAA